MKLSVIISNRNDLQMLIVTIRSCLESLRPLPKSDYEIVIVDNSDPDIFKLLKESVLSPKYLKDGTIDLIRQNFPSLYTARETAVLQSKGKYIFCLDSHMITGRDSIVDLIDFMDSHEDDRTIGFVHAPIAWAHQHEVDSKHDRDMSVDEMGPWGKMYDHVRTITWKGMPWICRRDWWLDYNKGLGGYGALSRHQISWGGGDMFIGIKPWLLGFRNWAVPTNPCIHIGPFPGIDYNHSNPNLLIKGGLYRTYGVSGKYPATIGYLIACYVLGGEAMMLRNKPTLLRNFPHLIGIDRWWETAKQLGSDDKKWLDERKVMTFEQMLETQPWNQTDHLNIKRTQCA